MSFLVKHPVLSVKVQLNPSRWVYVIKSSLASVPCGHIPVWPIRWEVLVRQHPKWTRDYSLERIPSAQDLEAVWMSEHVVHCLHVFSRGQNIILDIHSRIMLCVKWSRFCRKGSDTHTWCLSNWTHKIILVVTKGVWFKGDGSLRHDDHW